MANNQMEINLPDSGMLYYINNIFASDFIHDFRYGGAGTNRLNSLAKKVDAIRRMIGLTDSAEPIQEIDTNPRKRKKLFGGRDVAIMPSSYDDSRVEVEYGKDIDIKKIILPEKESTSNLPQNQSNEEVESYKEFDEYIEKNPIMLNSNWEKMMKEMIDTFGNNFEKGITLYYENGQILNDSLFDYLTHTIFYEQTPLLPYDNTVYDTIEPESQINNNLNIIEYGNYPFLNNLNGNDENLIGLFEQLNNPDPEIQSMTLEEKVINLFNLNSMLAFQLEEYVSELVLSITGYIGSKPIDTISGENIGEQQSSPEQFGGKYLKIRKKTRRMHIKRRILNRKKMYKTIKRKLKKGGANGNQEEEGQQGSNVLPPPPVDQGPDDMAIELEGPPPPPSNVVPPPPPPPPQVSVQNQLPETNRVYAIDAFFNQIESLELNKSFYNILKALTIESYHIEKNYYDRYNEMEEGLRNLKDVRNVRENQQDIEYMSILNEQIETIEKNKIFLNIDKEVEIQIIDKIYDRYVELYMYQYYTSNEDILNNNLYWIPNNLSFTYDNMKLFFKVRAELLDILDKNYIKRYIKYPTEIVYKSQNMIIDELTCLIFENYNPMLDRLDYIEIINTYDGMNSISNNRAKLLRNYPTLKANLEKLFGDQTRVNTYPAILKNILIDGRWASVRNMQDDFAIQLLHSSYFKNEIKEIILDTLSQSQSQSQSTSIQTGGVRVMKRSANNTVEIINPTLKPNQQMNCSLANEAVNNIKEICARFKDIDTNEIRDIFDIINAIIGENQDSRCYQKDLFDALFQNDENTRIYYEQTRNKICTLYSNICNKIYDQRTKRNADTLRIFSNEHLITGICDHYTKILNQHCLATLRTIEQEKLNELKRRKIELDNARREAEGEINKQWASELTRYAAKASLIITESINDTQQSGVYTINESKINQLFQFLNGIRDTNSIDYRKNIGNLIFYLCTIYILLKESDLLNNNNKEKMERFFSLINTKRIDGENINTMWGDLFTGDIDQKTLKTTDTILRRIFPRNAIPTGEEQRNVLNKWKNINKTLINNAVNNWPGKLSKNNSFCPMSSINDAQSTCSNYQSALNAKELETADMNIMFQNSNKSLYYNLGYIVGKPTPADCRIVVNCYLGNGMNDTVTSGNNASEDYLFISKDTNMNVSSKDDDKTLGACNVLGNVIETIRKIWTSMYTSFPGRSPNEISELCWDIMLTKYNYFNFLKCSHLKALGDSTQELNGALIYGGYTSIGNRTYNSNTVRDIFYYDSSRSNRSNSGRIETSYRGEIEPFLSNGYAKRGTLSNDRQAGSRSIWLLTCLPENVVNQEAFGGYSGPGATKGDYVLASVKPPVDEQQARRGGRSGKKSKKTKAHRRKNKLYKKKTRRFKHKKRN